MKIDDTVVFRESNTPYEEGSLVAKVVKHEGKLRITVGLYGCGYCEEYYVAEIQAS